jgi:predicted TIM-barrel fold metal-dependent hydrolase
MKLDAHIHVGAGAARPERLRREMHAAGIDGGCLISPPPQWWRRGRLVQAPAAERLALLKRWTDGAPVLFPLFWIDPTEPDARQQVDAAVSAGVAGFKVICSAHAPGDPRAMPVYRAIARHDKPVLFHSGILWDGRASSDFNRPAAFEALLEVPRLRFALAHMSWPWLDECLAVYGKFLNASQMRPEAPEMFIDLTPGTPPIYRREALVKLYTIGYDVQENVLFGTDCVTATYNAGWSREWQARDAAILETLGVGRAAVANYFGRNLQRWLSGNRKLRRAPAAGE